MNVPLLRPSIFLTWLLVLFILVLACSQEEGQMSSHEELLANDWTEIEKKAEGKEVRIFMWGGDSGINQYMDEWVAPYLLDNYHLTLIRTPMDTGDILQKLLTEKRGNREEGTMDIIWINGDNFRNAKSNDLLWGSFSTDLPNVQKYMDQEQSYIHYDQGTEIDGLEAPWGSAQYVFFYDSAHVDAPPQSFAELEQWVQDNPGKFTYPDPQDFTGTGFLAHLLYEKSGDIDHLLEQGFDEDMVQPYGKLMWKYLNDIKPFLWRQGETYPESLSQLDQLYRDGEVWMTMGFNEARAQSLINEGVFPETTQSFVLDTGSIGSVHYLSIPFNSPQPAAALVAINAMLSPQAQLAKMDPEMWGEGMVLDTQRLSESDRQAVQDLDRGASVLSADILSQAIVPEVDSLYKDWMKENWLREVVQPQ